MCSEDQERQAFEKWVCDEYPWGQEAINDAAWVSRKDGRGYYIVSDKYDCLYWSFIGWKARSRQEIELPPVCDIHSDDMDKGYDICHYRIQEKLKQQGIPFKIEGADRWKK